MECHPAHYMINPKQVADELFVAFREKGGRSYGENVTELQHALQCATFAERDGEPPLMIAACLLHDYGHLVHDLGEDIADKGVDARHEAIGANRLRRWFGEEIAEPVRLHVPAKRYLCWKDPAYLQGLSEASMQSLQLQGGVMNEAEALAFQAGTHFATAIRLRYYDDLGKVPEMLTPELEHFRPILESLVRTAS